MKPPAALAARARTEYGGKCTIGCLYGLQEVRVRSPVQLKQLRYVPVRHLRPELPA